MQINDLIVLKTTLSNTKVGKLSSDTLRKYLKLSVRLNTYNTEWEELRRTYFEETAKNLGYDMHTLTEEQGNEIFNIAAPALNEYLVTDVTDVETKIFSWDELYDAILNCDENKNLTTDQKTLLTNTLCYESL